jgi:hypothetical protein
MREDGDVLLLLPPSEAKTPGGDGSPLAELPVSNDAMHTARVRVLRAVAAFCARTPRKAQVALKLPPGSAAADLASNIAALDAPTLTAAQRACAERSTLVFSGAFGALGGGDPVPPHRVPASATLPRIGGLTSYWKKALAGALLPRVDGEQLVVDLRSSDYAAMWQPAPSHASRVVVVRVLEERGGRLQSVSWSSKHGKGLLARELLTTHSARRPARTAEDVITAAGRIGYEARPRSAGDGLVGLDLVVPAAPSG